MSRAACGPPPQASVINRQRAAHFSPVRVEAFVEYALERQGLWGAEVSVLLVGLRAMRALNRRWRGLDAPTDVLSFPQRAAGAAAPHAEVLGDVVICVPLAQRQAAERGHCLAAELDRLCVHGVLHLAGYEHEGDAAAARAMRRREEAILRGWRR